MKFSVQEEYGLRFLLRIGRAQKEGRTSVTIPELSQAEGISQHTVAKILRLLRIAGFLESGRGVSGGYSLAKPPNEIMLGDLFSLLGGRLYDEKFCSIHSGDSGVCTNLIDCSIRSVWRLVQDSVDGVVNRISLRDLI